MNIDLLKEILMSEHVYWVFAKRVTNVHGKSNAPDQIFMASIPSKIEIGKSYEEITLKDLEDLNRIYLDCNIFINIDYPPFQLGISFYEIWKGYPIQTHAKDFLKKALELNSDKIFDYKILTESLSK